MNDEAKDEFKGKVVAEFAPPCESVANKASVKGRRWRGPLRGRVWCLKHI